MFNKILIANRGEIALRIIRACKELGIKSLLVYSKADENSLPVRLADEAVCIGQASSADSYLMIPRIISAAEIGDVDAIHPGYGFLSENPNFAQICQDCNITFIGPTAQQMLCMGDKARARETMKRAGVKVTPGSDKAVATEKEALEVAKKIGYPVMIKASAGGGGRGMRTAHNDASLIQGFHAASTEAEHVFGNGEVYIEKLILNPRHVEVQILGDKFGNVIALGERDCSLQRRHQKMIEECPAPSISKNMREQLRNAAIKAAKAVKYVSAGTIEFLVSDKEYYFMEMNTRIQVEHSVTEMACGIDIIKEQIRIAAGERIRIQQKDVKITGHAIECRITAENPYNNFAPCPGLITFYATPGGPGIRIDSHVYSGYRIPPYYDSMISKLIVHAPTREEAIKRCKRALDEYIIEGIPTNIPFEQFLLETKEFIAGEYDTGLIERFVKGGYFEQNRPLLHAKENAEHENGILKK